MLQGHDGVAPLARELRQKRSLPELLLWRALRARPGGFKFRRQYPSGRCIAGFYCHAAGLVIEPDSEAHARGDRPARAAWFAARGLLTARLVANDVLDDRAAAVRHLVTLAATRTAGAQ